jgi:hypothetical protein
MKKLCIGNFLFQERKDIQIQISSVWSLYKNGKAMERYDLLKVAFRDKALSW